MGQQFSCEQMPLAEVSPRIWGEQGKENVVHPVLKRIPIRGLMEQACSLILAMQEAEAGTARVQCLPG